MEKEPIIVKAIEITGLRRYPQSLVQQELGRVRQATTFGALLRELDDMKKALHQTDLFEDVRTTVGGADAQCVHVTIALAEKKPYKLKVGATTSGAAGLAALVLDFHTAPALEKIESLKKALKGTIARLKADGVLQ